MAGHHAVQDSYTAEAGTIVHRCYVAVVDTNVPAIDYCRGGVTVIVFRRAGVPENDVAFENLDKTVFEKDRFAPENIEDQVAALNDMASLDTAVRVAQEDREVFQNDAVRVDKTNLGKVVGVKHAAGQNRVEAAHRMILDRTAVTELGKTAVHCTIVFVRRVLAPRMQID